MKKLLIMILLFALPAFCMAADVTLQWNANIEPDLAGYNIYYKSGFPGPPYEARINVGNVTRYTVTGLDPNQAPYYFVATAYDISSNESDYSNEVSKKDMIPPANPTGVEFPPVTFKEVTTTTTTSTTVRTVE